MSRLEIRLLGGFEVHWAGRPVRGFESQKVRGLCAHLAAHRRQAHSRERLATLLWAEKSEEAARRNLRQALHNLRSALAAVDDRRQALNITHRTVQLSPEVETWVDVDEFERAVRRGLAEAGPDPYQLTLAASLYTGDFLAGFFIKDSPPFEEWMITEQERHRDAAIDTFRTLIESYLRRGEYRLGIQYARRLLAIDPLSENAHRYLMRLYSLSGRRSRALSQFETLRNLLNAELAVEPMPETRELFEQILIQAVPSEKGGGTADEDEEPVGPLIPMVGRRRPYEQLQAAWQQVQDEGGRLTVLHGESGIGKSRLAKSFVDAATAKRHAAVLSGRSYAAAPLVSYRPFGEILRGAFADILPEDCRALLGDLPGGAGGDLLALAPALAELAPELAPAEGKAAPNIESLASSILAFLDRLARPAEGGATAPVILLLDDLHWTDPPSRRLLAALVPRLAARRLWILATSRDLEPLAELPGDRIGLERLGSDEVQEIAASLLGASGSELLGGPLAEWSGGLPLAVAELINTLWDQGVLLPRRGGQWTLDGPIEQPPAALEVTELIKERLRRLPTSARRLLALAAVAGQVFDAELVQKADREHLAVVDICIRLMLERWLIRQFPVSWSHGERQGDLVLWAQGARRGTFEFAHQTIREAVLDDINPLRRQVLHAEVAEALAASRGHEPEAVCEELAYHYLQAGDWARALPCLELAAEKAHAIGAAETAEWYADRSLEVVDRLRGAAASAAERDELSARRRAVLQWRRRSETA